MNKGSVGNHNHIWMVGSDKGYFDSHSAKDYDRTVQGDGEKRKYPKDRGHCGHYLRAGILVPRILPEKPNLTAVGNSSGAM